MRDNKAYAALTPRIDRFMEKVYADPNCGCWLWSGSANKAGYGNFWDDGKCLRAHRYSYAYFNGHLSADADVRHTCDFPPCVNPAHLIAGTTQENIDDMWRKGRAHDRTGERNSNARLTEFGAQYVRDMAELGYATKIIAKKFGIHGATVRRIVRGDTWIA